MTKTTSVKEEEMNEEGMWQREIKMELLGEIE